MVNKEVFVDSIDMQLAPGLHKFPTNYIQNRMAKDKLADKAKKQLRNANGKFIKKEDANKQINLL